MSLDRGLEPTVISGQGLGELAAQRLQLRVRLEQGGLVVSLACPHSRRHWGKRTLARLAWFAPHPWTPPIERWSHHTEIPG